MAGGKLKVLSLFAGIGGFDLGLERTGGFETVAFCEIDPFCRRVLAKHWPEVPCYEDVRELTADQLRADGIVPDVICGGFPCQDISDAGRREGITGERSGLWSEYARLISKIRPRFVFVENVSGLLSRGLGKVLSDLAAIGYSAEWHCLPASAVGAPHRRDRIWIVAHADSDGQPRCAQSDLEPKARFEASLRDNLERFRSVVADAASAGSHAGAQAGIYRGEEGRGSRHGEPQRSSWWAAEPNVGRVAHGVPARVDRLRALGNAVVPQIPELIGRAILASIEEQAA